MMPHAETALSIVVVNYETFELTCQCLRSVFQHTAGVSYELILVDNASKDRDPEDFLLRFPDLHLVRSQTNVGFAAGCNLGLRIARGDVVLLLNSDIILTEDTVGKCYRRLTADASVDVISPRLVFPDGRVQYSCRALPSIGLQMLELLRLHKLLRLRTRSRLLSGTYFPHDRDAEVDAVWGTVFMFKRKVLDAFPRRELPSTFFLYGEDMEWCLLLRRAGYRILFYAGTAAIHMLSASSNMTDDDPRKVCLIARNRRFLIRKYYGPVYAYVYHLLACAARVVG
jgi:GT2 family glycosyltransferase